MFNKVIQRAVGGIALALLSAVASADIPLNLREPVTAVGEQVLSLHNWLLIICTLIFVGVFGVMFYSIFQHRKSRGAKAAHFHENVVVEIVWTVVPFIVLVLLVIPATKLVLQQKDTKSEDLTIKVTGYQWKWGYDYLQDGISFYSTMATPRDQIDDYQRGAKPRGANYLLEVDNHMVVPVGKKVRLLITAADVIHSWYVPELYVKQDAIPGFVRASWFKIERPGTYRGVCAELCGKDHGFMPIVVEAMLPDDYAKWVAAQKAKLAAAAEDPNKVWTKEDLVARGKEIYEGKGTCASCHKADGSGVPPQFPALKGSAVAQGPVAQHIAMVLSGKGAMPPFAGQLSDTDIAAVVTYERNAWGNKAADMVQPSDVKAARK